MTWNVYETTLSRDHRIRDLTEVLNHRFSKLVRHNYPSVWKIIKKMRLELASDETKLAQYTQENLYLKKKKIENIRKYEK